MAEAEKKQDEAKHVISHIGKRLTASGNCPNKTTLVKLLKQGMDAFLVLEQSGSLEKYVKPLRDSLVRHSLLDHKDKDVRLLVGICLCEVIRVLAPNPGFTKAVSRDIFRFLLSIFEELDDTASPFFSKRAKLVETIAKLRFCLVMLDIGCEDLVIKLFESFFSVVRENHPQSLISSILSIITSILEEKAEVDIDSVERSTFQSLLDVVLENIIKGREDVASASFQLAVSVVQNCGEKVESCIYQLLKSCILNRDAVQSVIKESYHEIILEVYQIAPQLSLSVIPLLTNELLTDQVDVRIKVLNLIRKLLAFHGQNFSREYPYVFVEFLNRFSDKSAEVRLTALSCAKALYMTNPSHRESLESAIKDRLLDHDDKVRMEAVNVACELAKTNLNRVSSDIVTLAAERLRDKKISVRNRALKKLLELYQEYCTRRAAGITFSEHIEEIPCKFLMLCYEKDCQEFRPQSMELVLEELFPASLSMKDRTRHWIIIFSRFEPPHLKALKTILSQKRRLRDGLKVFLDLCHSGEDNCSGETELKLDALIVKMSSCFPNPTKAKDCFYKLKQFRDKGVFSVLQKFLSEEKIVDSGTMKDVYLKEEKEALSEFFHILSRKCAFNIFGRETVQCILDNLSSDDTEERSLKNYNVQFLLTIISAFPSLLKGSEPQFQLLLLEGEIPFNDQFIELLAKEGYHMPIKLSDMYSSLEKVCVEGTRAQSKLAVSAISALADTSEKFIFSELCKVLMDSLRERKNVPTVLQSLGCMAQYSVSAFDSQEKEITNYIVEEIFQQNDALASKDLDSNCCSCELKVFGLKVLVRSFLPYKNAIVSRPISFLLDIIQKMLQNHGFCAGSTPCEQDEAFIRLAAAKSILRLSKKWDLHISPTLFHLTILMSKDNSPEVRRTFISKIRKLLINHAVPVRYACAFPFAALDSPEDLRTDALKYLEEFIQGYGKGAQIHETTNMEVSTNHPAYIVVFLIHVLVYDPNFPAPDCRDGNLYAEFLSPLFITVQALVKGKSVDANLQLKSYVSLYLRSIFNVIKKAEDAVDAQMTPKLHLLAEAGLSILDSLNTYTVPLPPSPTPIPTLVLLPSSLYRSGSAEMREVSPYPSIGSKADASFSKNLVSSLKAQVSWIGCTGTKHNQKNYEKSLRPTGARHGKSSSKSCSTDKLLIAKTKEQIVEPPTGQEEQFETSTCEAAYRDLRAKSSFSGDSVTEPALPQNEVNVSSREADAIEISCSDCFEPSRLLRAQDQVNHFISQNKRNTKSNGEELVGKHIKLWSPIEKCYYSGVVASFDSHKSSHQINYKTGEVDVLSLDSGTWEFDSDDLQARACDQSRDCSANVEAETLDACTRDSKQENTLKRRDPCIRNVSQAVKKPKRHNETIGSSTSETIVMTEKPVRRSQRLKV
ncbi:hypothetical protein ACS0TY_028350 [Phlomoides rotata]